MPVPLLLAAECCWEPQVLLLAACCCSCSVRLGSSHPLLPPAGELLPGVLHRNCRRLEQQQLLLLLAQVLHQ